MTFEEKKDILLKLGLDEDEAEFNLSQESDIWAVLPIFRLLKPLNDNLKFYQGKYKELIEKYKKEGSLDNAMPTVASLVKAGASVEDIEKYAYELTLQAYETLLYRLDDAGAAEYDIFMQDTYDKCNCWRLAEIGSDHEPTGRYMQGLHGKLPFPISLSEN